MPCIPFKIGEGEDTCIGIICQQGRQEQKKCVFCGRPTNYLCDYPIGNGEICNRSICKKHKTVIGEELAYCPIHAIKEGLFKQKTDT